MCKNITQYVAVLCVMTCTFFLPMTAKEQAKYFTVNDFFDFERVMDPQISPDGKRIIYVRQFADIMTDKRYSNLWIINFDGTGHRPLTTGFYSDSSPRWSPDGSQIIFISDRDGKPQIYKRWMDTGQTVLLSNLQHSPRNISWSPDGKSIVFASHVPSKPRNIAKLPAAPPDAKWAEPAKVIDRLVYRYDKIGYSIGEGYRHIFVLPSEGGTPRQISSGDFNHNSDLVWTPDNKCIITSANRKNDAEYDPNDSEVYEFSVADGKVRALTDRSGPDGSPALSPDGRHIAYIGYDDKYQGYQLRRMYVMNRDGGQSRVVIKDLDRSVWNIQWAGDSKRVSGL